MPIIKVETPQGIVDVEIEGDTPTLEEQRALYDTFFADQEPKVPKTAIDFSTATIEEMREFAKKRDELGVDPLTQEPVTQEGSLKDEGVDYTSGLKNFMLRSGLAGRETDEEKAVFLTEKIGADGFRQDKGGRFIITKEGRKRLNMPDGPEFAVDEEGFSLKYDVADFIGEAGVPLTVGVTASILTGGMGPLAATGIVGASTFASQLFEEAVEAAQGYQRQTIGQIGKDAAWEGVFGATGEGVGRLLSGLFGRLFKGSGSATAEEAKQIGREMRDLGFQPTVEGGAPGAFGILTRLQAVYEGISPNKKAAEQNVKALMQELKGYLGTELRGTSEEAIETLGKTIQDDIQKLYMSYDEALTQANKQLNTQIEKNIAEIMAPLKGTKDVGGDAVQGLKDAKDLFNENVDFLYKKVDQSLGKRNQIIPFGKVQEAIDAGFVQGTKPMRSEFGGRSAIGDIMRKVKSRATKRLSAKGLANNRDNLLREMYATPMEATAMRNIMSELDFSGNQAFGKIKDSLDSSFDAAEDALNLFVQKTEGNLDELLPESLQALVDDFTTNFGSGSATTLSAKKMRDSLTLLRRTKQYYAKGFKRLNDPIYQAMIKATKDGKVELDPIAILRRVVKKNEPKVLERLLRSRRGVSLAFDKLDEAPVTVEFGDATLQLDEAKRLLQQLDVKDPTTGRSLNLSDTRRLRQEIQAVEKLQATRAAERAKGQAGIQGEELRQSLASAFLRNALEESTTDNVVDGIKFARAIDDLGTTKNILFKNELKEINELTSLTRSKAVQISDDILEQLPGDLSAAVSKVKEDTLRLETANKSNYLKALRDRDPTKIVDTIFTRDNPQMIKNFINNTVEARVPGRDDRLPFRPFDDVTVDPRSGLTPHQNLVERVRDAAMSRMLRSIGDVNSPMFQDDFLSGRLGGKLKSTLEGYGKESIEAMFGKDQSDKLFKLSEIMIRASDKPLAGKGGLAAPSIALGLSIFGLLTAPIQTLGAIAFYTGMSRALRSGPVLDIMLASRKPGADKLGQALQTVQTIAAQLETQTLTSEEGPFNLSPEMQRSVQQITAPLTSSVPNVTPGLSATPVGSIDPTNPIVNPDPATQALAQALSQRPPS